MSDETKQAKDVNINVSPVRLDLSEPATVFTKRISDLLGGLLEPWQMKRVARAEVEVALIKAAGEIEVADLQRRAITRFVNEEAHRQSNMEEIVAKAAPQITDAAKPNEVSQDWITNFFAKCRLVSDDEMQTLWAKVLAGEANAPGSYSKRALTILDSLNKKDAELFTTLCRFNWTFGNVLNMPIIVDSLNPMFTETGLVGGYLHHLVTIGLATINVVTGFGLALPKGAYQFSYAGRSFVIRVPIDSNRQLPIGQVMLTEAGRELSCIVKPEPVPGFREHVVEYWRKSDWIVEEGPFTKDDGLKPDSAVSSIVSNPIPRTADGFL